MKRILCFACTCLLLIGMTSTATADTFGFEGGSIGEWEFGGQSGVRNNAGMAGGNADIQAHEGTYAAWIGTVDFDSPCDTNDYTGDIGVDGHQKNWISREYKKLTHLDLYYNYYTEDFENDNPGFEIEINGASMFHLNAYEATEYVYGWIYKTGWQQFSYTPAAAEDVTLKIYSGNTKDGIYQSWAYVDAVTTAVAPEPVSSILFLAGGATLGYKSFLKKRKKKKA